MVEVFGQILVLICAGVGVFVIYTHARFWLSTRQRGPR
jgi:hypothetical protein